MSLFGKAVAAGLVLIGIAAGQGAGPSARAKAIQQKMSTLRGLADNERATATKALAVSIRDLPSLEERLALGASLSNLATEGDNGKDTLQAVADTLAEAIRQAAGKSGLTAPAYEALARLARYESVTVNLNDNPYKAALGRLEQIDRQTQLATFSLKDLTGKQWSLQDLRGSVVLVSFWATWCPPCRKEMPDMDALYKRFQSRGLVVLAISNEEEALVRKFLGEHPYRFPILLDLGGKAGKAYQVEGIPKSFVYDRGGKIVATGVDQRTERQFLEMLAKAGLR
jgi:peroxiredoxin